MSLGNDFPDLESEAAPILNYNRNELEQVEVRSGNLLEFSENVFLRKSHLSRGKDNGKRLANEEI